MTTLIPEVVAGQSVTDWGEDVDVVVAGFGIAGGCAAVAAAEAGARVLVLERAGVAGGTSALAGGHFYLGVEHFHWLKALGFSFERSYYPEKAVIQPGTQGLMYTGNEKVWPFRDLATPAPRGHKVPVPGDTQGAKLVIDLLVRRATELGVRVCYDTAVDRLIADVSGSIVGVTWRRPRETGAAAATSVILATGGFVMNREMVAEHVPQLAEKPFVLGTSYDDGSGIRLGRAAQRAHRPDKL